MLVAADFRVIAQPFNRIVIQLPVNPIITKSPVQIPLTFFIIAAEYANKTAIEWNDSAVEKAVR